jgi:hypothetical protein
VRVQRDRIDSLVISWDARVDGYGRWGRIILVIVELGIKCLPSLGLKLLLSGNSQLSLSHPTSRLLNKTQCAHRTLTHGGYR